MEKMPKGENLPPYERSEALAEQFERTEKLAYGSGVVEAFDIQPETLKSDVPVFFGTGWSASRGIYEAAILGVADRGRRVLSLYAPHGVELDQQEGEADTPYATAELRKAAAMLHVLETKEIEQLDIVAHSESALWTLIVAHMHPEKVRSIVLIDPAGLIDDDTLPRLAKGFALDIVQGALNQEKLPRPHVDRTVQPGTKGDLFGALKNIAGNPIRSLKEVLAIRDADIRSMLEDLKGQGKKIVVIQGARDEIFPMDKMQRVVNMKHVDGFYSVYGGHNEMTSNPEAYITVIDHALDALARLQEKQALIEQTPGSE